MLVRVGMITLVLFAAAGCARETAPGSAASDPPSTAAAAPQWSAGWVTAPDGVKLFYRSRGEGAAPLVVPVGFYLEEALAPLAETRRVVFYDPRCRGRSECGNRAAVSLETQIGDLEALRTQLGFDSMALLGWSGLGMEMAQYALRHPERVTRIVQVGAIPPAKAIMDAAGDRRSGQVDATAMAALDARIDAGEFAEKPAELCRLYNELTTPSNFADPSFAHLVPDICVYENEWPKNLWPYFGELLPSFGDWDLTAQLESMPMPRLVIHGREDGIPLEGAEAWAAAGDARLLVLARGTLPVSRASRRVLRGGRNVSRWRVAKRGGGGRGEVTLRVIGGTA